MSTQRSHDVTWAQSDWSDLTWVLDSALHIYQE